MDLQTAFVLTFIIVIFIWLTKSWFNPADKKYYDPIVCYTTAEFRDAVEDPRNNHRVIILDDVDKAFLDDPDIDLFV